MEVSERLSALYAKEDEIITEINFIKEQDLLAYLQENKYCINKCFKTSNSYLKILYILGSHCNECTVLKVPRYFNPVIFPSNYYDQIEYKYCIKVEYDTIQIEDKSFYDVITEEEVSEEEFVANLEAFFKQVENYKLRKDF